MKTEILLFILASYLKVKPLSLDDISNLFRISKDKAQRLVRKLVPFKKKKWVYENGRLKMKVYYYL